MARLPLVSPKFAEGMRQLFPLVRPNVGQELTCVIWTDEPLGTHVHFIDGRTTPCTMETDCPGCLRNLDRRFEAYLWIEDYRDNALKILAIPYLAAVHLNKFCEEGNSLFARMAVFTRKGKTKRSQLGFSIRGCLPEPINAPNLPSLEFMLMRIWGMRGVSAASESDGCAGPS